MLEELDETMLAIDNVVTQVHTCQLRALFQFLYAI
jgi:hypothetical protein